MTDPHAEARRQVRSDLGLMREMADAVDQDRGHNKSLLTRMIRNAADDIRDLSAREERLRGALEQERRRAIEADTRLIHALRS